MEATTLNINNNKKSHLNHLDTKNSFQEKANVKKFSQFENASVWVISLYANIPPPPSKFALLSSGQALQLWYILIRRCSFVFVVYSDTY